MLLKTNLQNPQARSLKRAVEALQNGGIIAYPTDTVYGIGCDIRQKKAIDKLKRMKKLHKEALFSLICSDLKDISKYAKVSNFAYQTMRRLLPGPYTFILESSRMVPRKMLDKRKTVGIRVPDNEICIRLIRELGNPIITTSARLPGEEVMTDPSEIEKRLKNYVDIVLDSGIMVSEPSSIIEIIDDDIEIIRVGKGDVSSLL